MTQSTVPEDERQGPPGHDGMLRTQPVERFDRLTRLCAKVLDVAGAAVHLMDGDRVRTKSSSGTVDTECPRDSSLCGEAMLAGEISVIPDTRLDERARDLGHPALDGDSPAVFYMSHPLYAASGRPVGTLSVLDGKARDPTPKEKRILTHFARAIQEELQREVERSNRQSRYLRAIEADYRNKLDRAERQARTDSLTGVWNRRMILEELENEVNRSNRENQPLGVMMLDLNDFKRINDEHGHLVGDTVLREVGQRLNRMMRSYDRIGRYGGDEFLIVLKAAARRTCRAVAKRIEHHLHRTITVNGSLNLSVKTSLGFTVKSRDETASAEELIGRADTALYRAKQNGGRPVSEAGDDPENGRQPIKH